MATEVAFHAMICSRNVEGAALAKCLDCLDQGVKRYGPDLKEGP